ncbi:hypothetical protein BAE44_0006309 [Dichanthelium oligosanthes]|uniref:NB-ARC domain-containing protein n=1 Tax=Dichanthelium oligosanthes TaxID=888268 RepID=A0A1E5W5K5_9POAL|nr:hypothetical protein BAE44_0006309 [Dichanthelium oligosanthes]
MKVVSIVGCGGLENTTVANQVYRKIAEQFDCQAFVSLSQNPDMVMIFRSMLSQVKKNEYGTSNSCDQDRAGSTISRAPGRTTQHGPFMLSFLNLSHD